MTPRELAVRVDTPTALTWLEGALAALEDPDHELTVAGLRAAFGWERLPWYKRLVYRARIRASLEEIRAVLGDPDRRFADVDDERAEEIFGSADAVPPAYAIGGDRVYFTSRFAPHDPATGRGFGPKCRAAMVLHEAVHVFDGRSGEDAIHVSEWDPRFDAMPPDLLVHNPSAYASFAAQIHARALEWPREARYGAGNPAL